MDSQFLFGLCHTGFNKDTGSGSSPDEIGPNPLKSAQVQQLETSKESGL